MKYPCECGKEFSHRQTRTTHRTSGKCKKYTGSPRRKGRPPIQSATDKAYRKELKLQQQRERRAKERARKADTEEFLRAESVILRIKKSLDAVFDGSGHYSDDWYRAKQKLNVNGPNVFNVDPTKIPAPRQADLVKYVPDEFRLIIQTWLQREAERHCFEMQWGKMAQPIEVRFVKESIVDATADVVESDLDNEEKQSLFWRAAEARIVQQPCENEIAK